MYMSGYATRTSSNNATTNGQVLYDSNTGGFGTGAYLHRSEKGFVFSHSVEEDNDVAKSPLNLSSGEVMTVQLDPFSGKLTYSKAGCTPFVQQTSIRSTST